MSTPRQRLLEARLLDASVEQGPEALDDDADDVHVASDDDDAGDDDDEDDSEPQRGRNGRYRKGVEMVAINDVVRIK